MTARPAASQKVHLVRPLQDPRWDVFVERHPQSSVFHTTPWLEALRRTYGYTPFVLTTSPPGRPLENGWAFCAIDNWLTGRRWVSLPFSDHCHPLMDNTSDRHDCLAALESLLHRDRLRYFEIRPLNPHGPSGLVSALLNTTCTYCHHEINLAPDIQDLFSNCHKNSTQRKIRRAEREQLGYQEGRSAALLAAFYDLQLQTRRRHGLPPQPKKWFRNVTECLGEAAKIRVAFKGQHPVAAILTIRHKSTTIYKYGCSDAARNSLGGMHLLLWRTIEESKREGVQKIDLGRSERTNEGLIAFKDRWGSKRSLLCYSRFTSAASPRNVYRDPSGNRKDRLVTSVFSRLPESLARVTGSMLYKHIG